MRGCTESISDNQKGIVGLLIFGDLLQQLIDLYLAEVSVSFDEFDFQKLLEGLVGSTHDGGIVLKVDLFAGSDGF